MAAAGELGPFATGIAFCNAISVYRDVAEFARAAEWADSARRWCERRSTAAFQGVCRAHRAEILRLRGAWTEAAREAATAAEELEGVAPGFTGDAYYEIAEVRLRLGDLEGAWRSIVSALELDLSPLDHARPSGSGRSVEWASDAANASPGDFAAAAEPRAAASSSAWQAPWAAFGGIG